MKFATPACIGTSRPRLRIAAPYGPPISHALSIFVDAAVNAGIHVHGSQPDAGFHACDRRSDALAGLRAPRREPTTSGGNPVTMARLAELAHASSPSHLITDSHW
jgi:hypothetical protein